MAVAVGGETGLRLWVGVGGKAMGCGCWGGGRVMACGSI